MDYTQELQYRDIIHTYIIHKYTYTSVTPCICMHGVMWSRVKWNRAQLHRDHWLWMAYSNRDSDVASKSKEAAKRRSKGAHCKCSDGAAEHMRGWLQHDILLLLLLYVNKKTRVYVHAWTVFRCSTNHVHVLLHLKILEPIPSDPNEHTSNEHSRPNSRMFFRTNIERAPNNTV